MTASNCRTSGQGTADVYDNLHKHSGLLGSDLERACFEKYEQRNWHANYTVQRWVCLLLRCLLSLL